MSRTSKIKYLVQNESCDILIMILRNPMNNKRFKRFFKSKSIDINSQTGLLYTKKMCGMFFKNLHFNKLNISTKSSLAIRQINLIYEVH